MIKSPAEAGFFIGGGMDGVRDSVFILEKMHSYYLSAFDKTLVVVGLVFTLVGVVVPAGISYFQSRQARREADALRESVSREVEVQLESLMDKIKEDQDRVLGIAINDVVNKFDGYRDAHSKSLDGAVEDFERRMRDLRDASERDAGNAMAGLYYVQALHFKSVGKFDWAAKSAAKCASRCLRIGRYGNLKKAVDMADECFRKVGGMKPEDVSKSSNPVEAMRNLYRELSKLPHEKGFSDLRDKVGLALGDEK